MPKNVTAHILYRGDTRPPELVRSGFFPQQGHANVSTGGINAGASTAMVCGTLSASVAATYYSARKYFNARNPECNAKNFTGNGYVYAFYIPTGRGILNYELAAAYNRSADPNEPKSKNVGSLEVSSLCVPWCHVIGWRKLPTQDECKTAAGAEGGEIAWEDDYVENDDFKYKDSNLSFIDADERRRFEEFTIAPDVLVMNTKEL
jgi:hypothetical protein